MRRLVRRPTGASTGLAPALRSGRSLLTRWPLGARGALVVGILATLGCHTGPSFEKYQGQVSGAAGPNATDCGVVRLGSGKAEAIACVESALAARKPVLAVFQVQGIDSQIFMGIAVDGTGRATRLMWDSDTYGGGSRYVSKARIVVQPCDQPVLKNDNETVHCSERAGA